MTLVDTVIRQFEPQLATLLGYLRRAEQFLGPEDDWVEDDRRVLFEAIDPLLRPLGRSTITEKGENDYVATVSRTPDEVEVILDDQGYQRNILSTRKYRAHHDGGKQWAVGSWVLDPSDTDSQHHVYLFRSPDGGTDIYAHSEASVTEPAEHDGGDALVPGDPKNLESIFNRRAISFNERDI